MDTQMADLSPETALDSDIPQDVAGWYNLDDIVYSNNNPNEGDVGAIVGSIEIHGYRDVIQLWDKTLKVGEHRLEALKALRKSKYVPGHKDQCLRVHNGQWQVLGLPMEGRMTTTHADAFMLVHNRSTRLGRDDEAILAEVMATLTSEFEGDDLTKATGYSLEDLQELLEAAADNTITQKTEGEDRTQELQNRAEELRELWQTERGQLWQAGPHRIMCGDSTNADDVKRLVGNAEFALMVTDPPYGVNYDPDWRNEHNHSKTFKNGVVLNDDIADWTPAWMLFPGNVAYVWHAGKYASDVSISLNNAGFIIRYQIIWNKQKYVFGRGDYHWKHEPCWYAVKKGATGNWQGDRTQNTVWDIQNSNPVGGQHEDDETPHSTQKPVECMARPIRNNSSIGQYIYDPFLGSGTTIVACEKEGRIGYGMELHPPYVAVILERLSKLGLTPSLLES